MALGQLSPDLYSMDCLDKHGNNALHIAASKGFKALTKQILDQGNCKLLWAKNYKCQYPVQVCREEEKYATAAVMLKSMNDWLGNFYYYTKQDKEFELLMNSSGDYA